MREGRRGAEEGGGEEGGGFSAHTRLSQGAPTPAPAVIIAVRQKTGGSGAPGPTSQPRPTPLAACTHANKSFQAPLCAAGTCKEGGELKKTQENPQPNKNPKHLPHWLAPSENNDG